MAIDVKIRIAAVEAVKSGISKSAVARHYGFNKDQLLLWMSNPDKYLTSDEDRIARLAPPNGGVSFEIKQTAPVSIPTQLESKQTIAASIWVSDLHAPFMHQDAFHFIKELHSVAKPKRVKFAGDETDQHALGKYPANPDGMTAGKELERAIEQLLPFYKEFPVAYVCESNHAVRAAKKAFISGIPQAFMRNIEQVMNAPDGWQWADHWIFDDVLYCHGDPYHGRNAVVKHMHETFMSVAIGHTHSYGRCENFQTRFRNFFALDGGCLIDIDAYAFRYASKINRKPTLGSGIVYDKENAEFVRMELDAHGRWTGKLRTKLS